MSYIQRRQLRITAACLAAVYLLLRRRRRRNSSSEDSLTSGSSQSSSDDNFEEEFTSDSETDVSASNSSEISIDASSMHSATMQEDPLNMYNDEIKVQTTTLQPYSGESEWTGENRSKEESEMSHQDVDEKLNIGIKLENDLPPMLGTEFHLCAVCDDEFKSEQLLQAHFSVCKMSKQENVNDSPTHLWTDDVPVVTHICSFCDEAFNSEDLLEDHLKNCVVDRKQTVNDPMHMPQNDELSVEHTGNDPLHMPEDVLSMEDTGNNPLHIPQDDVLSRKLHRCFVCKAMFDDPVILKTHLKMHTGQKRCDICPRMFRYKCRSVLHKRTHLRGAVCKCNVCGKGFYRKNALMLHKRLHNRQRKIRGSHDPEPTNADNSKRVKLSER